MVETSSPMRLCNALWEIDSLPETLAQAEVKGQVHTPFIPKVKLYFYSAFTAVMYKASDDPLPEQLNSIEQSLII